jgi:phage shock protein A
MSKKARQRQLEILEEYVDEVNDDLGVAEEQVASLLARVEDLEGKARAAQCIIVQLQDAVLRLRRSLDEVLSRRAGAHEHLGVRYKS